MSISQPKISNPCKKFIEFKGDSGVFRYWDKTKGDKGGNVELKYPIKFIVLDELNTIKGFSDELQSGIFSNEVHSLLDEDLTVRAFKSKGGVTGKYNLIKDQIHQMGGKFCKSVYVAILNDKNELELANFQLMGAAFSSWMDHGIDKSCFAISVSDCSDKKKGKVEYKVPNWKQESVSSSLIEKAIEMDKALQKFLVSKRIETENPSVQNDANENEPTLGENDPPF